MIFGWNTLLVRAGRRFTVGTLWQDGSADLGGAVDV